MQFQNKTFEILIRKMMSLAEEIQLVAENADKCVNYPIGDKLEQFMR